MAPREVRITLCCRSVRMISLTLSARAGQALNDIFFVVNIMTDMISVRLLGAKDILATAAPSLYQGVASRSAGAIHFPDQALTVKVGPAPMKELTTIVFEPDRFFRDMARAWK
ncbi:MAG: hypothetical protein WD969_10490 [Paracoccaceae bacterium]